MNVQRNYFCDDTQFFMPLYYCLAINHNFDDHVKSTDSIKWKGWIVKLKNYINDKQELEALIKRIDDGELATVLGKNFCPSVQDVVKLIKNIKRLQTLDTNLENQLGYKKIVQDKQIINNLVENNKKQPVGYWDDFDSAKFKSEGMSYMDNYINLKSGTTR